MPNTVKNNHFNNIINDFKFYCIHLGLSDSSVKDLLNYVNNLFYFLTELNISSLQQVSYKQLVNFSISGNAAPTTVKARIWALKKFFSFLLLYDHITINIAKELRPPKIPKKETPFLTEYELKIIYTYLSKNILDNYLAVRNNFLNANKNEALFISKKGNRIAIRTIEDNFNKLVKAAAIIKRSGRATPHSLRHTCATMLNEKDVKILTIQNIPGHSNPNTTINYYLHTTEQVMREAQEKLPLTLFLDELIASGEIKLSFQADRYKNNA